MSLYAKFRFDPDADVQAPPRITVCREDDRIVAVAEELPDGALRVKVAAGVSIETMPLGSALVRDEGARTRSASTTLAAEDAVAVGRTIEEGIERLAPGRQRDLALLVAHRLMTTTGDVWLLTNRAEVET